MAEPPQEADVVFCSPIIRWISELAQGLLPSSPSSNVPCTHSIACQCPPSQKARDGADVLVASSDPDTPILVRVATLFSLFPFAPAKLVPTDGGEEGQTERPGSENRAIFVANDVKNNRLARLSFERALFDYLYGLLNAVFHGGVSLHDIPPEPKSSDTIHHPISSAPDTNDSPELPNETPKADVDVTGIPQRHMDLPDNFWSIFTLENGDSTESMILSRNRVIGATIFAYQFLAFALRKDGPFDHNPRTADFATELFELDLASVSPYWSLYARNLLKCISKWTLFFDSERNRVASLPPQERTGAWARFICDGGLEYAREPILQHFNDAINALDRSIASLNDLGNP